jgi:hypothetical protein
MSYSALQHPPIAAPGVTVGSRPRQATYASATSRDQPSPAASNAMQSERARPKSNSSISAIFRMWCNASSNRNSQLLPFTGASSGTAKSFVKHARKDSSASNSVDATSPRTRSGKRRRHRETLNSTRGGTASRYSTGDKSYVTARLPRSFAGNGVSGAICRVQVLAEHVNEEGEIWSIFDGLEKAAQQIMTTALYESRSGQQQDPLVFV